MEYLALDNFKEEIDPKILKRGIDYYDRCLIENLKEVKPETWTAVVAGSMDYTVEVILSGRKILSSYCDCPYDMGPYCKHEVAVYMVLKEEIDFKEFNIGSATRKKNAEKPVKGGEKEPEPDPLEEILDKLPPERLKQIVRETAEKDENFKASLLVQRLAIDNSSDMKNKKYYTDIIRSSVKAAKGRHGFIGYYESRSAADGAWEVLHSAEEAIKEGRLHGVSVMFFAVLEVMVPAIQQADDSDGVMGGSIFHTFNLLREFAENELPEEERKQPVSYTHLRAHET